MDTTDEKGFSPPYNVPWATFLNMVQKVAGDLPNKIDRSYLVSQSGTVQGYLISAFRGFGLIDEEGRVTDTMRDLATDLDQLPARIGALLTACYPLAVELGSTNATPGELDTAFSTMFPRVTGESRVKAVRFYLSGAEYAGLPRSSLWKSVKGAIGGGGKKKKASRPPGTPPAHTPAAPKLPSATDMKQAYFDLLLEKAKATDGDNSDLLNRIEKLIGMGAGAGSDDS